MSDEEQISKAITSLECEEEATLDSLPETIKIQVLSTLDIPALGALAQVSRSWRALARSDASWERHLKYLIEDVFENESLGYGFPEGCTKSMPIALSKRPLWKSSTEFKKWALECDANTEGTVGRAIGRLLTCPLWAALADPEDYGYDEADMHWLNHDVALVDFYFQLATIAGDGVRGNFLMAEDTNRCPSCFGKIFLDGCTCDQEFDTYEDFPALKIFSPGWDRRGKWKPAPPPVDSQRKRTVAESDGAGKKKEGKAKRRRSAKHQYS